MKVVVAGDCATGKTCLVYTMVHGEYPTNGDQYDDNYIYKHPNDPSQTVTFIDTMGQEDSARFRMGCYSDADAFILCYSIISPFSLENIKAKWVPEISRYSEGKPIILVGTKADLRTDEGTLELLATRNLTPLTTKEGKRMKDEIGAIAYIECSSLKGDNIEDLLLSVTSPKPLKKKPKTKGKKCSII